MTTNATGGAVVDIDLSAFKETSTLGSALDVTVEWVGPTRELITETATVRYGHEWRLLLSQKFVHVFGFDNFLKSQLV